MEYTLDGIEKILNFKTWSDKKKVDGVVDVDVVVVIFLLKVHGAKSD